MTFRIDIVKFFCLFLGRNRYFCSLFAFCLDLFCIKDLRCCTFLDRLTRFQNGFCLFFVAFYIRKSISRFIVRTAVYDVILAGLCIAAFRFLDTVQRQQFVIYASADHVTAVRLISL